MTETRLDSLAQRAYLLPMTKTAEINQFAGLAELVKQVQAGDEIVLTNGHKPVAKIVSAIGIMEEMESSGWPPTKKFTKKDEEALLREIHEDIKKHRGA